MVKVFYDHDADLADLAGQTVGIIGYGIQGRAQSHNMRDSGVQVIVGNRDDEFRRQALADGFEALDIAEAAQRADILLIVIPDEVQAQVYQHDISPHLSAGKALVFAHGFAIRYNLIQPPADVDLLLVSPRMPGGYMRERFLAGSGAPAFVDVRNDASGKAWKRALALAKAVGMTRPGVMQVSFEEETELDHFAEHYLYPLIIGAIEVAYDILVKNGYTPEAAIMELYGSGEVGEVMLTTARVGLYGMLDRNASPACQYGIYTHKNQLITDENKRQIQNIIDVIKNGGFARDLIADQVKGHHRLKQLVEDAHQSPLVPVETTVRDLMKFGN
ncbi:MAG: ketol-acid reductoisomerase [Chloroflexota bacterium]|nr:ketol-acid reductoisomerase [Chloroflexota bacterium]